MFKKLLSAICALALILGMIVPWTGAVYAAETETEVSETCPYCSAAQSEWVELTADTTPVPGTHYYLAGDVSRGLLYLNEAEYAGTYCLDLAGHTLTSSQRAIVLGKNSDGPEITFNVLDSSAEQDGKIEGFWGRTGYSAGVIYLYKNTTMNVYGGTICASKTGDIAKNGGVFEIANGATLNMYDGNVEGASVVGAGGAIEVGGTLNMSGGSITGGTAATGNCVYATDKATINLSGDAQIEEIYFAGDPADSLTISGAYTGAVSLDAATAITAGNIAVSDDADVTDADISVVGMYAIISVSGSYVVAAEGSWCDVCQKAVTWESLTGAIPDAAGHYKLTKDVSTGQVTLTEIGGAVCLDLNGFKYASTGRVALLKDKSGDSINDTLNIMDSSENKTGIVIGQGGGTSHASGMFRTYASTVLNLYDVTLQLVDNGNVVANDGGAIYAGAEVNMYGGKIIGGNVYDLGGAVYVSGTFNMVDGVVISGSAANKGDCIYVTASGKISLSGSASPEQICFADSSASNLTINGDYTGKTELAYNTVPAEGTDIGNCSDAVIGKENITIANSVMCAAISGSNLIAVNLTGASVTTADGIVTYYDTLAEAAAACTAADTIKLLADNAEDVTITNATLDLYGCDLKGNITVTGKLYLKDSATDDFTVNDERGYGKVSGTVTGDATYAESYMPLQETDGTSYHRYVLELTKVNLRPASSGIYYTGDILLDEAVQGKLERYGITLSIRTKLPTADPEDTSSLYTAYTAEQYGAADASSVLIQNIMDGESSDAVNAATTIYARPYICFTDGTYFYGEVAGTSMQKVTELADKQVPSLDLAPFRGITALYNNYKETISGWNVPNLTANALAAETAANDRVLKVLVIGNSHGLDSTNLLYEVIKAEGLPEEYDNVILGAIYTGGCSVSTHAKCALGNGTYDYWRKNDGTDADGAWQTFQDPTMNEVLINEDWDVVLLQEMNTSSARSEYFENDNIETVFKVVTNTLGYEPKFMWNMVWANPEIPESYVNYLFADGDDGSGNDVASGAEGDDNDTSDTTTIAKRLAWIFQTQRPSALELWGRNYVTLWENSRQVMYNNIVSNVHNYVVGKSVHNIGMDDVMPNATAIQYAIEWMGMVEQDMYRDYTHVSDLGRLTVAYLYYAKLTGKTSIGDPNYTVVSQVLENVRQPMGYTKDWSAYSDVIKNSVNFALADPYGVIQNYTYAEYLALTAEEQAAYEASFAEFSVHSGWTFEMWLEQAVAGVTYTDYVRMTEEQKAAFQALRADFDTWYADVVENLRYAEFFLLTADEQAAYAELRGSDYESWLAAAEADFTYTDYVSFTYEQQQAYQATFESTDAFDAHYAAWLADMTYEEYQELPMHQKLQYKKTYSDTEAFLAWYYEAKNGGNALDGKKVIFFGNSHTYYGRVVSDQGQSTSHEDRINDTGVFAAFCEANGIDVSVTNYVFGNHELSDFYSGSCAADRGHNGHDHFADITDFNYDYLILQQGTSDNENDLVGDVEKMIAPFREANPDVKVVFLAHLRAYTKDYAWLAKLKDLEELGITVVDWGGMLDGILDGTLTLTGSKETYNQNTFIISKTEADGYHPNLLTGNIITQMLYCAITGEKAEGLIHNLGEDNTYHKTSYVSSFRSTYYVYDPETNFDAILQSAGEMQRLQRLIDQWLEAKSYRNYQ